MSKRRANGEGNIRKRKDGRWEGRYTAGYDPNTGKRIIKNVLGRTQAEAKAKLAAAQQECEGLDVTRTDEYTVTTWLRSWYELYAQPNIRTATADRYKLMIETYTIPRIGKIKLKKLTSRDLQSAPKWPRFPWPQTENGQGKGNPEARFTGTKGKAGESSGAFPHRSVHFCPQCGQFPGSAAGAFMAKSKCG